MRAPLAAWLLALVLLASVLLWLAQFRPYLAPLLRQLGLQG
jgi:hypothetical protein